MACHELAALRLALMNVLAIDDPAEQQHELAELGASAEEPGPLRSLSKASDLASVQRLYEASLAKLGERVSKTTATDPKLPYLRSLLILTRSVELELKRHVDGLHAMWRGLEELHDFTHELFPRD